MHGNQQWAHCHPSFMGHHHWNRRFLTNEEKQKMKEAYREKKIQWLEHYKESLEKEMAGINERLEELKK